MLLASSLEIDWRKYENTETRLETIEHDFYSIPKVIQDPITGLSAHITKGTQLILQDLKESWDKDYLLRLKRELTLLVSPFAGANDFAIEIYCGID